MSVFDDDPWAQGRGDYIVKEVHETIEEGKKRGDSPPDIWRAVAIKILIWCLGGAFALWLFERC